MHFELEYEFDAVDEATRIAHRLQVWRQVIGVTSFLGADELTGMRQIRTRDGQQLNRLAQGRYGFAGRVFVSNDPNAP